MASRHPATVPAWFYLFVSLTFRKFRHSEFVDTWLKWYMTRIIFCIGTVTLGVCVRIPSEQQARHKLGQCLECMHMDFVCQRGTKIDENRGWMSLKSSKMEVWGSLWVAWGVFGEIWIRVSQKIVARMSPR